MKGLLPMKKESLIQFNDNLVLTYSVDETAGEPQIVVYLEKPNKSKSDFNSAEFLYPSNEYKNISGFSDIELEEMRDRVEKGGRLALEWTKENYA